MIMTMVVGYNFNNSSDGDYDNDSISDSVDDDGGGYDNFNGSSQWCSLRWWW